MERGTVRRKVGRPDEEVLPDVYVDGAHNVSAVEAFAASVLPDVRAE